MLRKLFLLLSGLAAAAVGLVVWTKRDELKGEIERARGEWRAATRRTPSPTRSNGATPGPRPAGKTNGRPPAGSQAARFAPRPAPAATSPATEKRCAATTRSGSRCTRDAEPGSEFCWQHAG